jgi:hypothetical protein
MTLSHRLLADDENASSRQGEDESSPRNACAEHTPIPEKQPWCLLGNAPSREGGDTTAGLFYSLGYV